MAYSLDPMTHKPTLGLFASLVIAAACGGGSISGEPPGSENTPGGEGEGGQSSSPGEPGPPTTDSQVVRLSHTQYANTLRDLLGVEETPETNFVPDALNGFNFDTSNDLRVDPRLGPQYRGAAEELAARAVNDEVVFARVVPCNEAEPSCADDFIDSFGERAFRRPLSEDERARFRTLFDLGEELGDLGDPFRDGVQLVVEAMLQAPQFIYRAELSEAAALDGRARLDPWEVASRLSYFIYDSMPDDQLFARARAGELGSAEEIAAEVSRMLGDERAWIKFTSFHEQVWQFSRFAKIAPDPSSYPDAPSDLIDRVRSSSRRFLESVIADGGGLRDFLTAPYAYADSELGAIYGADVEGDELTRIEFPDGERKGFLMQVGFLASHAYSVKTDPIHRGLFILRDVLCREIPDPPPGAQDTPPPEATEPINTTRDEITLLTGQLYCPTCHSQINEPGFSFEAFDAMGRAREQENGFDVDTTGSITLDGAEIAFDGASEMIDALAESDEARACYSRRWLEFAYGRRLNAEDSALRERLAAEHRSVQDIVTTLATSPEFLTRDVSEVSE